MRHALIIAATLLIGASGTALADRGAPKVPGTADVYTYSSSTSRGRLGLVVLGLTDNLKQYFGSGKDGVLVGTVEAGSPAEKAGVKVGDVLADVDGKPIDDGRDVWGALGGKKQGEPVALMVMRNHEPMVLTARLAADAPAMPPAMSGALDPGALPMPFGMFGTGGDDDGWMKKFEQRMDQLERRMHKLDGA